MTKQIVFRLVAAALSIGLALALFEGVLRLAPRREDREVSTRYLERHRAPMDRPDFRHREPAPRGGAAEFVVMVIGDSFTWGSGVHAEDAYPDRLEIELRRLRPDLRIRVVNWSRPGWNTVQEYRSVAPHLDALDPDLVLLGFVLNDAEPAAKARRDLLRKELDRRTPAAPASAWLHRCSRLFRLIWERLESSRQRRAFTAYYRGLYEGRHWELCRSALEDFRDAAASRSIPLAMAIFPVFDSPLDTGYPYLDLHRKVRRVAGGLGIPALDLLETFWGLDPRRLAVTPFTDPHPNELAHRIAADRLVQYIVERGWLPPRGRPGPPEEAS